MVINDRDDVIEHKKDDSTAANLIKKNEAIQHREVNEVTLVTDDRYDVIEHFNDGCHQKEKLLEDFAQHGTFTMEFAIEEDFTEVFANQSIVH